LIFASSNSRCRQYPGRRRRGVAPRCIAPCRPWWSSQGSRSRHQAGTVRFEGPARQRVVSGRSRVSLLRGADEVSCALDEDLLGEGGAERLGVCGGAVRPGLKYSGAVEGEDLPVQSQGPVGDGGATRRPTLPPGPATSSNPPMQPERPVTHPELHPKPMAHQRRRHRRSGGRKSRRSDRDQGLAPGSSQLNDHASRHTTSHRERESRPDQVITCSSNAQPSCN